MGTLFVRLDRLHPPDVWETCGVLRIGRLPGCEVLLDDPSVSRRHASIRYEGGRWLLADGGSANGTFLNGVRLTDTGERVALGEGDLVQFGTVVLVVETIDFVAKTEAAWLSGHAAPSQTLVLLRQHPLSRSLPAVEGVINRFVAINTRPEHNIHLWSPSNTNPRSIFGEFQQPISSNELIDVQRFIHESIRRPFHSFGGLDAKVLVWNENTVVKLAKAIRESSDFPLMPILADALEEAGCDDQDILVHCRQHGRHLPCCWALRAVLAGESNYSR